MPRAPLILGFAIALTASAVAAITIDGILASPATYDGQHVTVAGTLHDLQEKTSQRGNAYDVFSLCADRCVHVFTFGRPKLVEEQKLTVSGTFSAVKHVGSYTFRNEIEADDGSL